MELLGEYATEERIPEMNQNVFSLLYAIGERLEEISTALHMIGANQARRMRGLGPAYEAEDFGGWMEPREEQEVIR